MAPLMWRVWIGPLDLSMTGLAHCPFTVMNAGVGRKARKGGT
jgi:hypothetical protein